ncbi:MAG: ester cyclase [Chloroflexia bacterium]
MSAEENKQLVRRFLQRAWNEGNLGIVDELLSPLFCRHLATSPYLLSREGQRQSIFNITQAFANFHLAVEDMLADGDKVVFRGLLRGTHVCPFRHIQPTHRDIVLMVIGIVRVEDGQIVEQWGGVNDLDLMHELAAE